MSRAQRANADDQCLNIWVDRQLYDQLGQHATATGSNMTAVARAAIRRYLAAVPARAQAAEAFDRLKPALQDHIDRDLGWPT